MYVCASPLLKKNNPLLRERDGGGDRETDTGAERHTDDRETDRLQPEGESQYTFTLAFRQGSEAEHLVPYPHQR